MKTQKPITVRDATSDDSHEMRSLLNKLVDIGGSTAIEAHLSADDFSSYFLNGPNFICCFVAVNQTGEVLGFQAMERHAKLPPTWADIATFARAKPKTRGVGTALFKTTLAFARLSGIEAINATIRADNVSGLAYYAKMGFVDYSVHHAVPLLDGTPVDRISRKLIVESLKDSK